MEQIQQKTALSILIIVLILAAGYFLLGRSAGDRGSLAETGVEASAEDVLSASVSNSPTDLPRDIPFEEEGLVESASAHYIEQVPGARQISLAYESSKPATEKYQEYKSYMQQAGFRIKEDVEGTAMSIFGMSENANLSIVITSTGGGETLVQIAYLDKSL